MSADLKQIENELKWKVTGEVRVDPVPRSLYATDASSCRILPCGVVIPKTAEDAPGANGGAPRRPADPAARRRHQVVVVASGFSRRHQLKEGTAHQAKHLIEVLAEGLVT